MIDDRRFKFESNNNGVSAKDDKAESLNGEDDLEEKNKTVVEANISAGDENYNGKGNGEKCRENTGTSIDKIMPKKDSYVTGWSERPNDSS